MTSNRSLFQQFVVEMNDAIQSEGVVATQKESMENLFRMEKQFKKLLMSDRKTGTETYVKFMCYVLGISPVILVKYRKGEISVKEMDITGNMLSCRVYFREKQSTFNSELFKAFHRTRPDMLHKFAVNYLFIKWVMTCYKGPHKRQLNKLKKNIEQLRTRLCETNLPLAINRARLFWSKVPESHLEYMDMIQASSEGLLIAIDKFVPPYKTVFRSVAIGRMTLNMSTDYSATMVKLSPKDKRILYRTNKAKRSGKEMTQGEVTDFVNKSFKGVSQDEISRIELAATNVASLQSSPEGATSSLEDIIASDQSVEADVMEKQLREKLSKELKSLTIVEIKVLKLKNGDF